MLKPFTQRQIILLCAALGMLPLASPAHAASKWQDPTPEELSMTSQPQVPGASAVILYREEIVDDDKGTWSYYSRIKILNQSGRDHYSNISIDYPSHPQDDSFTVTNIVARTVHSDGTIIPFTGEPFDRLIENSSNETTREKVFTLPDVQIGSIIEYRYTVQLNPNVLTYGFFSTGNFIPTFYVQSDLFARKEHFLWHSNQRPVDLTSTLPGGLSAIKVKEVDPAQHYSNYTIDVASVMPVADEPYSPPLRSLVQKVVFYTNLPDSIHTAQDFWIYYGKIWSKDINDFIGSPSKLAPDAAQITAGASTPEEKLRKIYAVVQQMENTNFSRERSAREKKVIGITNPKSASDVLQEKHGDDLQLSILFVGLARAAGLNAYIMAVANRDTALFQPQLTTFQQLNDDVAIVELDGKELFLDPAEPFCPFGQLLWSHADAGGLRQTAAGTSFARSPAPTFHQAETRRVANLTLDPSGQESGTVDLAFIGAPALHWRQSILLEDEIALHKNLETYLHDRLPANTEVDLQTIDNLRDSGKPLIVHFRINGPLGSVAGKSRLLPTQLFQVSQHSPFTDDKRTLPISFSYPERILDGVRIEFPPTWQIDTAPTPETDADPHLTATYVARVQVSASSITLRREYILGADVLAPTDYPDLRNFFSKIASKDQEQLLIHTDPHPTQSPNSQPNP